MAIETNIWVLVFGLRTVREIRISRGGNRASRAGPGRAEPGQQWAGPKPGRAKINPVFSGKDFNSPTRPKNRVGRAK